MGNFTIKQVLNFTRESKDFKNRFDYMRRDVLKSIKISEIKDLASGSVRYKIITSSYPQYGKYLKIKGKYSKKQRKIKHSYDIVLTIDRMTLNTKNWKMRIGSQKKLKNAPQNKIQQVYTETTDTLKRRSKLLFKKEAERKKWISQEKKKIRKSGMYVSNGDWQSRVLGINQDFLFRQSFSRKISGHIYGRDLAERESKLNPKNIVFFTKHEIRMLEVLMQKGILSDV